MYKIKQKNNKKNQRPAKNVHQNINILSTPQPNKSRAPSLES